MALRLDDLRRGSCRSSVGRAPGSGARRSQHWDRLRVSRLRRSAHLRAPCLLRCASSLLRPTLCRLRPPTAAISASLSPGKTLSPLLLLLLIRLRMSWPADVMVVQRGSMLTVDRTGCRPFNIRSVARQHVAWDLSLGYRGSAE